jgi:hypothetical protein
VAGIILLIYSLAVVMRSILVNPSSYTLEMMVFWHEQIGK